MKILFRNCFLAILFSMTLTSCTRSHNLEFKGIKLGSKLELFESKNNDAWACSTPPRKSIGDDICHPKSLEKMTIAGYPIQRISIHFFEGKLYWISIDFNSQHFEGVAEALKQKYGKFQIHDKIFQTISGNKIEYQAFKWQYPAEYIYAEKYTDRTSTSGLDYKVNEFDAEFERRKNAIEGLKSNDL